MMAGRQGYFEVGGRGGPGRPKGSRNILGEAFLAAMARDFETNGLAAIEAARVNDPSGYIRVIAGLLPKEITGEDGAPLIGNITVSFVKSGG